MPFGFPKIPNRTFSKTVENFSKTSKDFKDHQTSKILEGLGRSTNVMIPLESLSLGLIS